MYLGVYYSPMTAPKIYIPCKFSFKKEKGNFFFLRYTLNSNNVVSYSDHQVMKEK